MNDLERDLRALFDERARHMDAPTAAPEHVLRRGRRREIRTVVASVVASVLVVCLAVAASSLVRRPADTLPGGRNDLPARSTTIGGVPVAAPAGWTLIDDTPMLNVVATSTQTCSFSAGGTQVDAIGSPVMTGPTPTASESCASQPLASPAGVAFMQLANFEVPLMGSVCNAEGQPATPLPNDGVALYVAVFPEGIRSPSAFDACPGAERYGQATGSNGSTFVLANDDGSVSLTMAAMGVSGPGASDADLAVLRSFFDQPFFGSVSPYVALDPNRVGPGYVLTAGGTPQAGWRLEAGIASYADNGTPIPASVFVSTKATSETATADESLANSANRAVVGDQVVQYGNLATGVVGAEVTDQAGNVTTADVFAWPQGLLAIAGSPQLNDAGGIWVAVPTEEGDVTFVADNGSQPTPSTDATPPRDLQTRLDDNGKQIVFGHDLGHDWEIHLHNGVTQFFVDGVENPGGGFSFATGSSIDVDVDGGTFKIGVEPPRVKAWTVTVDGTEPPQTVEGRYTSAQANDGSPANFWVIALPGSGTGVFDDSDGLPMFISWPTPLYPDGYFAAGSDPVVSWAIAHHTDQCALVKVIGADPSDSGTSDCLPSWYAISLGGGSSPVVGGVYGQRTATAAVVLPGGTRMTSAFGGLPQCVDIRFESNFASTEFCVVTLPVGQSTTIAFGARDDALGGAIELRARPGALDVIHGSPSPTP